MKKFQAIAACFVPLTLIGIGTLKSEEPVKIQGTAVVRNVVGTANYTFGGLTKPLKPNLELDAGTTITTGPESQVYLSVNGLSSSVVLQSDTTMAIPQMNRRGPTRDSDTETMLDLKIGSIWGEIKKVSAHSTYEINTPNGLAEIRGPDFGIKVVQKPHGNLSTIFISMEGQINVSSLVNGVMQANKLDAGKTWTPGEGGVHAVSKELIEEYDSISGRDFGFLPTPIPSAPSITIQPVFPTGSPPRTYNQFSPPVHPVTAPILVGPMHR